MEVAGLRQSGGLPLSCGGLCTSAEEVTVRVQRRGKVLRLLCLQRGKQAVEDLAGARPSPVVWLLKWARHKVVGAWAWTAALG